jgi:Glyoxalase-like domain
LLAAGRRPADVGQRGDEGWHVLADPEGNEFCLLRRPLAT